MKPTTIFLATALPTLSSARVGGPCESTSALCLCLSVNVCNDLAGKAFEKAANGQWPCPDDDNDILGCTLTQEVLCSRAQNQSIVECSSASSSNSAEASSTVTGSVSLSSNSGMTTMTTTEASGSRGDGANATGATTNGGPFAMRSGVPCVVEWLAGVCWLF